jgi:hypothetical protein
MTDPNAPRPDVPYIPGVEASQHFGHPSTWPQAYEPSTSSAPVVPGVPPPPRRRMSALWITLLAGAIVLVGSGAAVAVSAATGVGPVAGIFKDSGIAACETIRDNAAAKKASAAASPSVKASTDQAAATATYLAWRKAFAGSRHEDLRVAGTEVMDLINQLSGSDDNDADLGLALATAGQLIQKWSSLAGACANHGVTIPKITEMTDD